MISQNRLTIKRIQRMSLPELNMTANILRAIHQKSDNETIKSGIETTVAYIFQTARDKSGVTNGSK